MNIETIVKELEKDKKRIETALSALTGSVKNEPREPIHLLRQRARRVSKTVRNKIAIAQKARWAKVKAAAKKVDAKSVAVAA